MGYQTPPTLPDYSKLLVDLNSSGVQSWNPALYTILNKLISAVKQSQDVVVGTTIPSATDAIDTTVNVNGALSGDGSVSSPLAVKVDNTTIQISGDQLIAVPPGLTLQISQTVLNANQLNQIGASTNRTVKVTDAAGAGTIVIPIHITVQMAQPANAFTFGQTVGFFFSNAAGSLVLSGANALVGGATANITNNSGSVVNKITLLDGSGASWIQTTAANTVTNKDILGFLSGTAPLNAGGGNATITVVYVTITGLV